MVSRGCVTLCVLFVASVLASSQVRISNSQPSPETVHALAGKVFGADGRPIPGIHIELDNAATAIPVGSTYTEQDGTFELYNIPQGDYEVVAESAESEVSDQVVVQSERPSLRLRFARSSSGTPVGDAATSVARMLVPARAQRMYGQAYRFFMEGKYREADSKLDAALQIDPEYADALTLRALMMLNGPDRNSARQLLEQLIQIDPSDSTAYIGLAAVYNHQGRFDDAMRISEKGLSIAPGRWQAYLELAKASIAKDMYQNSLKLLRQAERLGGNGYAEVHLLKAYALVPLKLYKDARYELQAALARQPDTHLAEQAKQMLARLNTLEAAGVAENR